MARNQCHVKTPSLLSHTIVLSSKLPQVARNHCVYGGHEGKSLRARKYGEKRRVFEKKGRVRKEERERGWGRGIGRGLGMKNV